MRAFLRDPLAHFLIAGAGIWAVLAYTGDPVDLSERSITLTREQQAGLALAFERTMGRAPTDAELDAQAEQWVREEILYREALRLGLDQGDPVVRRRLSTKMDELASAQAELAPASDAVLEAWLKEHPERFAQGARFTFSHRLYESEAAMQRSLEDGQERQTFSALLPARMEGASYGEVRAVFGEQFAARLAASPLGTNTRISSGFGWHLVDLDRRAGGEIKPLSEIRDKVEADWRNETAAARRQQAYEVLREAYRINME